MVQSRLTVSHAMSKPLHLPDLTIKGFRGIDDLTIPRLGRVTLLAGKNAVGKSTVLEAVRLLASRGRSSAVAEVLRHRQEVYMASDGASTLDATALFRGRSIENAEVEIGPKLHQRLRIKITSLAQERGTLQDHFQPVSGLSVEFCGSKQVHWNVPRQDLPALSQRLPKDDKPAPEIRCEQVGPEVLSEHAMARIWDSVALTAAADQATHAIEFVLDTAVLGVALIGDGESNSVRRAVVRLKGQERPVPLRSLGDGAVRLFGVALALANSRGGFLLIDEAENGIHHSVQYDLWKMILQTAQANDVQVLATTHSWDCVRGFAYAAAEAQSTDGTLVRLDRDERGLRAVEYSEEDLKIAADQSIEVR